ncbi:MAG: P-II family nitrogen regulator [Rothia sp. (in: high G+C Gram-positive bacteria)]|nr:P-II family nitrogen regulator [Rothia sp. (in: high G+C Gram-positive bacteria)]
MKLITAIVQPERFLDIRGALELFGVQGMTVSEAQGYGQQLGHIEVYRGKEYEVNLLPKARIEILTTEDRVQEIIEVIMNAAHTDSSGDGKIWVTHIDEVVRIRTGERGNSAV